MTAIWTWLALFFLLFVTVLPFTTAFLGEHLASRVAVGFYWFNILALGITIWLHWRYAYRHRLLNVDEAQADVINRAVVGRVFTAQALYALAVAVCFVNTYVSIGLIVLIQLNYALGIFPRHKNS